MKYTITAVAYDKRGRVLSTGTNSKRTHPLQARYAIRAGMPWKVHVHAELSALLKARDRPVFRLSVSRFTKDGRPALAAPCAACRLAIKDWGVRIVEHT